MKLIKYHRRWQWLLLLLLLPLATYAQVVPWPADSVPHTALDSLRFLRARSNKENLTDLGTAIRTNRQALRLALRLGNRKSIGDTWRALGDNYSSDEYQSGQAQHCYEQALAAGRQARWPEGVGDAYLGMGLIASDVHNRPQALRYFEQAGQQYAAMPATEMARLFGQLLVLSNLINAYHEMGDDPQAARLARQAAAVRAGAAAVAPTKKWESDFLRRSANLSSSILSMQAEVYLKLGQPDSARLCVDQGLRLTTSAKSQANHRITLARIELSQHQPQAAYGHLQQALQLARHSHYIECLRDGLSLLPQVLHALHRPEAYDSLQAYVAFNDTINKQEGLDALAQAQAHFRSNEQQAQIRDLQKNRRLATQTKELTRLRQQRERAGMGGLVLLAGLVGGGLFWQYRRRQAAATVAATAALRTRLAADLHDDVGNLLTQVSMHSSLLRETPHTPAQTLARLDALAAVSRQAAQQMSDVVWGLGTESLTLHQLLARMRDHAQEVLPPAGVDVEFRVPPDLPDPELTPVVLHNLYLIFKEALHNVVKHAQATTVTVSLAHPPTSLTLTVADNGRGHDGQPRSGGNGLANMQARAQAVGGTVCYEQQPAGFAVVAVLPLAQQAPGGGVPRLAKA